MITYRLLRSVSLSHLRTEKLKLLLTVVGMTLGIAIYCAIRTANENALRAFDQSAKLLSSGLDLELASSSGSVTEDVVRPILAIKGVKGVAPRSSAFVRASSGQKDLGTIQLIGLDLFRQNESSHRTTAPSSSLELFQDPHSILVSSALRAMTAQDRITVIANSHPVELRVVGELPDDGLASAFGGRASVMDIANFQDLFDVHGRVDALGIDLDGSRSKEDVQADINKVLPEEVRFREQGETSRHAEKMSEAFRLNLNFLSCISLFVAVLLIYNTVSYLVLRRRRELSILRSIGASSGELFTMLAGESIVFGLVASVCGIAGGYALSRITVRLVSTTFSTLYLPVSVSRVTLSPELIIQCLIFGPMLALLGTLAPAFEVYQLPPRETSSYQQYESRFRGRRAIFMILAAICLAGSAAASDTRLLEKSLYMGLAAPTLLILSAAFSAPLLLESLARLGGPLLSRFVGVEATLALDHIRTTLRRSSVAVAAMLVSLGMCVGLSAMIVSFRQTVEQWIEHVTTADLYVSATGSLGSGSPSYLPDEIVQYLTSAPIADYDYVASTKVVLGEREIKVNGVRFESALKHDRFLFQQPISTTELLPALARGELCFVSETFAQRYHVQVGSWIDVPGVNGNLSAQVASIFYDYSSDQGVVLLDHRAFEGLFAEPRKEGVSLYLRNPNDEASIRESLSARFPDAALIVRSNRSLRTEVLRVFDDTFKITYALQGIALLIAGLTVLNTMLMLTIERNREFAVMRAIGASQSSLTKMVVTEALMLGAASVIGALVLGSGLAVLLVFVINKFFFGWSVAFAVPYSVFAQIAVATCFISALAGYIPGRRVAKSMDGGALRYE
ncbi:MAG: FtsX-like permease family protein [Bdellovibrionota bacterium]